MEGPDVWVENKGHRRDVNSGRRSLVGRYCFFGAVGVVGVGTGLNELLVPNELELPLDGDGVDGEPTPPPWPTPKPPTPPTPPTPCVPTPPRPPAGVPSCCAGVP